jgi:hypothetical protein
LLVVGGELTNKKEMIAVKKFCAFDFKQLWVKEL